MKQVHIQCLIQKAMSAVTVVSNSTKVTTTDEKATPVGLSLRSVVVNSLLVFTSLLIATDLACVQ